MAVVGNRKSPTLAGGAFDEAITEQGRVNVKVLARLLDLPLATLASAFGLTRRALDVNPTAPKAQVGARQFLMTMNELAANLIEKRYALFWLKTPNAAFGGRTAVDWLNEGDLGGVCAAIARLIINQPD